MNLSKAIHVSGLFLGDGVSNTFDVDLDHDPILFSIPNDFSSSEGSSLHLNASPVSVIAVITSLGGNATATLNKNTISVTLPSVPVNGTLYNFGIVLGY